MKTNLRSLGVILLTVFVAVSMTTCGGGGGGGGGTITYDGTWSGTTAQGKHIFFNVKNNAIDSIGMGYDLCGYSQTVNFSFSPVNISGNTISVSDSYGGDSYGFTGTFDSDSSASGTCNITKSGCGSIEISWSATKGPVDTIPPAVSSTSPANNATDVAVNTAITAAFSEPVSGINAATFTLKDSGGSPVWGTVTYSGTTATFTPASPLAYSTTYTATIEALGVWDVAGNPLTADYTWTFTTGAATDTTPPTVSSTSPANNATGVAVNTTITAAFSEPVSGISATTFTLKDSGGNPVTGAVTYAGTTATFTPASPLAYSTTYTATITIGVKDLAGNAVSANYIWTFVTGAASDTTPPTVSSTAPANNGTNVAVNAAITVIFSEPLDASTVSDTTFLLKDGSNNPVAGMVTYSGTTATFTPAAPFAFSTTYTATITTGVKDLAGNAVAADYTWTFITEQSVTYTGTWKGTSSQGKNVSFTVQNSGITSITVDYKIQGDYCTVEGSITTNFAIAQPITGNSFSIIKTGSGPSALSYAMQGTFTSSTAASGNLDFTYKQAYPNPTCNGIASAAWNATKQ